ncbi:MAG: translesion DNA synthesis-associated protein ImuA [Pseudomonadota bacterium]
MAADLEQLLQDNRVIWRGRGASQAPKRGRATGFAALDELLPEGGWPADAMVELWVPHWGVGELQLLRPAMAAASAAGGWVVWIAPPYVPYASALQGWGLDLRRLLVVQPPQREVAWVMEQALRQTRCAMVLAWPEGLKPVTVRRLQLAAEAGRSLGILLDRQPQVSLPVALRISLAPHEQGVRVTVLKSRAACRRQSIILDVQP